MGVEVQDPRTTTANLREWQGFTAFPSVRVETGNAYHLVAWEQMLGKLDAAVRSFEQSFFHEPMCWFVEGKHPAPPRSNQPLGTIRASGPEFSLSKPVRCDLDGPMQCRAARNTLLFFWHGLSSASSSGSPPLTIFKLSPSFWNRGPAPSQLITSNDTAHNGSRCLLLVWNLAGCGHDTLPLHFQIRVPFRSKILAAHLCIGCV